MVINAELFGGSYVPAMLSPQNPSGYPLEGQVHVNGQVVMGRSSRGRPLVRSTWPMTPIALRIRLVTGSSDSETRRRPTWPSVAQSR